MIEFKKSENKKNPVFFVKFGSEKNIESLRQGNIYTNNIQYFIDLEEKEGKIGIGDKDEASLLMNKPIFIFKDYKTKEIVNLAKVFLNLDISDEASKMLLDQHIEIAYIKTEQTKYPMFCLFKIDENNLINLNNNLFLQLDKHQIKNLKKEFKEYTHALIIPADEFMKRIFKTAKEEKIFGLMCGPVKYYNSKINQEERYEDFKNGFIEFWKKDCFKNQSEYRIIFDKIIENGQVLLNIGDISDISYMVEKDKLLNENSKIEIAKYI